MEQLKPMPRTDIGWRGKSDGSSFAFDFNPIVDTQRDDVILFPVQRRVTRQLCIDRYCRHRFS